MRTGCALLTLLLLPLTGCSEPWDFDGLVCSVRLRSLDCKRTCQPDYVAQISDCAAVGSVMYYLLDRPTNNTATVAEASGACGGSVQYTSFKLATPSGNGVRCADGTPYAFDPTKRYFVRDREIFLDVGSGL